MRLILVNQAANYLTIGYANAFVAKGVDVVLMTGSVHVQGEPLDPRVEWIRTVRWRQRPAAAKASAYAAFMLQVWARIRFRHPRHEVLFISIPPMAWFLALVLPNRCGALVWDVYPDLLRVTGLTPGHWLYKTWAALNRRALRRMGKVFTISEPMRDLLGAYRDPARIHVTPIWSIFDGSERIPRDFNDFLAETPARKDRFIVQYSGNVGVTHHVEALLDVAERLQDDPRFLIQIIGRGPRENAIREKARLRGLANVELLPFQSDERFIHSLSAAHVGVVALNPLAGHSSLPSKSYNLMALGIPALYIAAPDSELAEYARRYRNGACFEPGDVDGMADFLRSVQADPERYRLLSEGARLAAQGFRRHNADTLVAAWLSKAEADA